MQNLNLNNQYIPAQPIGAQYANPQNLQILNQQNLPQNAAQLIFQQPIPQAQAIAQQYPAQILGIVQNQGNPQILQVQIPQNQLQQMYNNQLPQNQLQNQQLRQPNNAPQQYVQYVQNLQQQVGNFPSDIDNNHAYSLTVNFNLQEKFMVHSPAQYKQKYQQYHPEQCIGSFYPDNYCSLNNQQQFNTLEILPVLPNTQLSQRDSLMHCLNLIMGSVKFVCREHFAYQLSRSLNSLSTTKALMIDFSQIELDNLGGLVTNDNDDVYKINELSDFNKSDIKNALKFPQGFENYLTSLNQDALLIEGTKNPEFPYFVLKQVQNQWYLLSKENFCLQIADTTVQNFQPNQMGYPVIDLSVFAKKYAGKSNTIYGFTLMGQNDSPDIKLYSLVLKYFYLNKNYYAAQHKWVDYERWHSIKYKGIFINLSDSLHVKMYKDVSEELHIPKVRVKRAPKAAKSYEEEKQQKEEAEKLAKAAVKEKQHEKEKKRKEKAKQKAKQILKIVEQSLKKATKSTYGSSSDTD